MPKRGETVDVTLRSAKGDPNNVKPKWTPNEEERDHLMKWRMLFDEMVTDRDEHIGEIKEGFVLYEGKSSVVDNGVRKEVPAMPMGRIFVEAKVAVINRSMGGTELVAKNSRGNVQDKRIRPLQELINHVVEVTGWKRKRMEAVRTCCIGGVYIGRVGYRKVMREIKEAVEVDSDNEGHKFDKKFVPVYDDLFLEEIPPSQFGIDENATTIEEANYCGCWTELTYDEFLERFGNDKRWSNVESVIPGVRFYFNSSGEYVRKDSVRNNGVIIEEGFHKILDQWVIVANGVLLSPVDNPLPDEHKELPFFCYQNQPGFACSIDEYSREDAADTTLSISTKRSFWTKGDPVIIKPMIDAQTGFLLSIVKSADLSSKIIVATDEGYVFKSKKWVHGDQAVGMKGHWEPVQFGNSNLPMLEAVNSYLMDIQIMSLGIDPRQISSETRSNSATEAALREETLLKRIGEWIEFNLENEKRLSMLLGKSAQQYYSKPEIVNITGYTEEDLEDFDEIIDGVVDGRNERYGKRFRRVSSSKKLVEKQGKDGKIYLSESEDGTNDFLARPETIRASNVIYTVKTNIEAGQLKAFQIAQKEKAIELLMSSLQLTSAGPNGEPALIDREKLPDITELFSSYMKLLGEEIGKDEGGGEEPDIVEKANEQIERDMIMSQQKSLSVPTAPVPLAQNVATQ